MNAEDFKKITLLVIIASLLVISFLVLKPILLSIMVGVILAVVFSSTFDKINERIKIRNISAGIICLLLILAILLPLWFLTPIFLTQAFEIYQVSQQMDFITPLKNLFPSLFASEQFSNEFGSVVHSFITRATNSLVNSFAEIISNFPTIALHLLVIFFTFFFVLRDKEEIVNYIKTVLPFSKEVEQKLFKSSKDITVSIIYGQVLIGIVQGLIAGIGFFIFGVNNALLLTLLASIMGILPILGTAVVWGPVVVYLFIAGNTVPAVGVLVFGIISSVIDNILRPIFVSRMTQMHPLIFLIGMVGGFFFFGIIGLILGPLILAYLFIILEVYRIKNP